MKIRPVGAESMRTDGRSSYVVGQSVPPLIFPLFSDSDKINCSHYIWQSSAIQHVDLHTVTYSRNSTPLLESQNPTHYSCLQSITLINRRTVDRCSTPL